jgi:hypothetical protein
VEFTWRAEIFRRRGSQLGGLRELTWPRAASAAVVGGAPASPMARRGAWPEHSGMVPLSCPDPARPGLIMAAGSPRGCSARTPAAVLTMGTDLAAADGFLVEQGGCELPVLGGWNPS